MYKVLYFNVGLGENAADESVAYPISSLRSFACIDATSLGLYFTPAKDALQDTTADQIDLIDLTIVSGTHRSVIRAISNEVANGTDNFITIANSDDSIFLDSNITACNAITLAS